jgi:DNA topoisomerase I
LYTLIWKRLVASQMNPAILDVTTIDIAAGHYLFRATGSVIKFPGFMKLYIEGTDDQDEQEKESGNEKEAENELLLPILEKGETLKLLGLTPRQHFTQPPPRYTEASLVKELEKKGIGRPSTYATILSTIEERQYVNKEDRKFIPTELGLMVTDLLVENFPKILDVGFTADLEEQLDQIEEGKLNWVQSLRNFYQPFSQELERAAKEMRNVKKEREEVTEEKCEKCGSPMIIKFGKFGKFLACSGFPKCRNTRPLEALPASNAEASAEPTADGANPPEAPAPVTEICENCGKPMTLKQGRYGTFLACTGYPECKTTKKIVKGQNGGVVVKKEVILTEEKCEKCGANMVIREGRYGKFLSCSKYPKCKFIKPIGTGVKCPQEGCEGEILPRRGRGGVFYSCSKYPDCKYTLKFKPIPRACPKCQAPFLVEKWDKDTEQTYIACQNAGCDYTERPGNAA